MGFLGGLFKVAGFLLGGAVWLITTAVLFARGDLLLALLALFIPPADFILSFVVSVPLGLAGLAAGGMLLLGAAISPDD